MNSTTAVQFMYTITDKKTKGEKKEIDLYFVLHSLFNDVFFWTFGGWWFCIVWVILDPEGESFVLVFRSQKEDRLFRCLDPKGGSQSFVWVVCQVFKLQGRLLVLVGDYFVLIASLDHWYLVFD